MKAISRALIYVGIFILLTSYPAAAQEKQSQDADFLRAKIEQFEKKDLTSKSSSVRIMYERTLLRLYNEFDSALQQDITELKEMQAAVNGTRAATQNDIALQVQKLQLEREETAEKIQTLKNDLQLATTSESPAPPKALREAEPQPTNVSFTPPDNNARPATVPIPVSDTLSAADASSPKAVARILNASRQRTSRRGSTATDYSDDPTGAKDDSKASLKYRCEDLMNTLRPELRNRTAKKLTDEEKTAILDQYRDLALVCPSPGLTGLLLGGVVVSQQEKNFSQSDPFFGFIAGYNSRVKMGGGVIHYRVQGIFQVQPQKATAPPVANASATPAPAPTPVDITNFTPFLASRKTFDIDTHIWVDYPLPPGIVRIGPYFGWGASTYIDSNELKNDETITKSATDNTAETKLDPTLGRASNDLKQYQEAGVIGNFLRQSDGKLFMTAQLLYGRYEALRDLVPGHNTSNRFVGRLRIFPTGLKVALTEDPNDKGISMAPMFGVELNAGRGPDQIKFFTGVAISITKFKPFAKAEPETPKPAPQTPGGTGGTSIQ